MPGWKSDFQYVRDLIEAGWSGALSVRNGDSRHSWTPLLAGAVLAPAAIGAGIGALRASWGKGRTGQRLAVAGFVGSAFGLGAGLAWTSRHSVKAVARGAMREVNTVRDGHWLQRNPIAYG